jgi:1-acyl-sn-glycerol-3-phosphate acyltransferase
VIKKFTLRIIYLGCMRFFLKLIVGVKYINKRVLKEQKQFILVGNHNSHLDAMALMASLNWKQLPDTHPIAAADYFGGTGIKARISKFLINAILIKRSKDEAGEKPLDQMSKALSEGKSLILFPEGSRGEPEKMQGFHKGIGVLLTLHPHIPYIPVYISGLGKVLPKGERLLVPFDAYVTFGEASWLKSKEVESIVQEVHSEIIQLKDNFDKQYKPKKKDHA